MPIGKDSIRKRVIGSDCAACGECAGKDSVDGKQTAGVNHDSSVAAQEMTGTGKAPARRGRPRKAVSPVASTKDATPAVTQSVLTNVSPEVVEKVIGSPTAEPVRKQDPDHVQITDQMPHYLL